MVTSIYPFMKNAFRLTCRVLGIALPVLVLVGCGSSGESGESAGSTPAATDGVEPENPDVEAVVPESEETTPTIGAATPEPEVTPQPEVVNSAPRLEGVDDARVAVGTDWQIIVNAVDDQGDELAFAIDGAPAWMRFNPETGSLSGTPAASHVGMVSKIALSVSDGRATTSLAPFSVEVYQPNRAPVINGMPVLHVLAEEPWSFTPEASDADNDAIVWSATNMPAWMTLDAKSGQLQGTPVETGFAGGITLSASDGEALATLGPFEVVVVAEVDLARTATAVQGSSYSASYAAENAIDGDESTINHTGCSAGRDWLEIDLGRSAIVSRLVVVNRQASNEWRLDGASVHLGDRSRSDGAFDDLANPAARIATLDDSSRQEIELAAPRRARYVTLETNDACLHVGSVEVHGRQPDEPAFFAESIVFGMLPPVAAGTVVGTVSANDAQGDAIQWSIETDAPFGIDADGAITTTRALEHNRIQRYEISVVASDGRHSASLPVSIGVLDRSGARLERWNDLSGSAIADLVDDPQYQQVADELGLLPGLEQSGTGQSNYGERVSALLRPTVSGEYVFSVVGDDNTRLSLSPTDDPSLASVIATHDSYSSFQNYENGGHSTPIRLEAGHLYYLEALHKEGGGSDHVSVGWRLSDASEFAKLPDTLVYVGILDQMASRPQVAEHVSEHLVEQGADAGRVVVELEVTDGQADALVYGTTDDVNFAIDSEGRVTVLTDLQPDQRYEFDVTISDGTHTVVRSLSVETTARDAIEQALATGDASMATTTEIVAALVTSSAQNAATRKSVLDAVFGRQGQGQAVGSIDWDPTHDSAAVTPLSLAGMHPLLISNHSYKTDGTTEETLALWGSDENTGRLLVFGGNPVHALNRGGSPGGSANAAMQAFMENSVDWLVDGEAVNHSEFDIVVAHQQDSYWGQHDDSVHGWLADNWPEASVNDEDACESVNLSECLAAADLLIIGNDTGAGDDHGVAYDESAIVVAVREARSRGVPVLYVRNGWGATGIDRALLAEFGVTVENN